MPFVSQINLSRGTGKCIVDLGCELYARRSLGPNQIAVILSRHGLSLPSEVERKPAKPAPLHWEKTDGRAQHKLRREWDARS